MTKHIISSGLIKKFLVKFNYRAITLLNYSIHYCTFEDMKDTCLREHELTHISQMKNDGKFIFLTKYLYYNIRYGYKKNPYEIEAYKIENKCKEVQNG